MKTIAEFKINYVRYLDENGNPEQELPAFAQDKNFIIKLYSDMMLARVFDKKAISLQRTGKLGTFPSVLGQEAVMVGAGCALDKTDVLVPYYRDYPAQVAHGVHYHEILSYWGGDERGSNFQDVSEDFPICVPIATQNLHATGVATAIKYRKQKRAVMTFSGDGCTSKGDFYEALNVAGIWHLPVVFVINNNQWAISVPRDIQSECETLAQKSIAAGFEGIQVDGNDIIAVYEVSRQALEKARQGKGPTLIEAMTYRLGDHTTADDANRYRPQDELAKAWLQEPVLRLRKFMEAQGYWSEKQEEELLAQCKQTVEQQVDIYLNKPAPKIADMFDYLYAELPESYIEQRETAIAYGEVE